jgi:hypothetical protein
MKYLNSNNLSVFSLNFIIYSSSTKGQEFMTEEVSEEAKTHTNKVGYLFLKHQ